MSDRNRNNTNWAAMLGLAVGAAGAAYLAYNAAQQFLPVPEEPENEGNRRRPSSTGNSEGDMREKHRAAAPYYFFLSPVTDSINTHSEPLSLRFADILDPSLGDLESSLQMNCVVDYDWLMAQYRAANQHRKPLTILYGNLYKDDANPSDQFVTAVQVETPFPNGSHHTKMCVLAYKNGSVRVCVHTANLVECEWDNCVQGIWLSPLCPALPLDADSDAGESPTNFKNDLIQYLSTYRLPQLQSWIRKLHRADFSNIKVFFVASVPGTYDSDKWGHAKLARLLRQHVQIKPKHGCPPSSWQIIAQGSNIGTLGGPESTSSFYGQIKDAMSEGLGLTRQNTPTISMVYPSYENVAASYDGLHGGSRLLYSRETHAKQRWIQHQLFGWKCDRRHRTKAMPHIKTYACVSTDLSELAWFHLTSCNLTQAAWGCKNNKGAIRISSYEAGVLFLPKFLISSYSFPIKGGVASYLPVFPMPYDLPLTQYTSRDEPWFQEDHP